MKNALSKNFSSENKLDHEISSSVLWTGTDFVDLKLRRSLSAQKKLLEFELQLHVSSVSLSGTWHSPRSGRHPLHASSSLTVSSEAAASKLTLSNLLALVNPSKS